MVYMLRVMNKCLHSNPQVRIAAPLTPSMDAPALVRFLWASSKFRLDLQGMRLRINSKQDGSTAPLALAVSDEQSEQAHQALDTPAPSSSSTTSTTTTISSGGSAAAPPPSKGLGRTSRGDASASPNAQTTTTRTLLDFALSRLHHDLAFECLTPSLASQLLSALAVMDVQPEPEFMDDCLLSLLRPDPAPATARTQSLSPFTPYLGRAHMFRHPGTSGILQLLFSLARCVFRGRIINACDSSWPSHAIKLMHRSAIIFLPSSLPAFEAAMHKYQTYCALAPSHHLPNPPPPLSAFEAAMP